ncbi:Spermidine/putrescine import ATP-binding protein PotA [Hartmannibacter diazotrophicus]|uniref:Spermidine/putrescine import ATP-binding protein PotA n=1 Tax=Hartmannibacter diazotrophicus TaxID=1482074 RepID=A0A2C9D911_9HYPH|nr:ABC transporter ATP-binding protein [Hartmannibacter diazotrophicus]SON56756.1 Spermidine/putrescine import ATP-binding protein PotA [Hartmannibacter diazotrophicus]
MSPTGNPDIEFRKVTKAFGSFTAVHGIDLAVPAGSFVALLGPSGCGKTTSLRMIGGFEMPTSGEVLVAGRDMAGEPPYRRPVNMVFQHYALFPHMTVAANVAYGLKQQRPRLAASEIKARVGEALEMVRLGALGGRRPHELSGGQQQRVALARALVNKPRVLLLDEPLAALDKKLRTAMQIELQSLQRDLGITFLLVTHDQEEALSMSDLVCVMSEGRIAQLGTPGEIYDHPSTLFVADFVGKTNMLAGEVLSVTDGMAEIRLANGQMTRAKGRDGLKAGSGATVCVRPEALTLGTEPGGPVGTIHNRIFLGPSADYAIDVPGLGQLLAQVPASEAVHGPGADVSVSFDPRKAIAFPT